MSVNHADGNRTHAIAICSENALHFEQGCREHPFHLIHLSLCLLMVFPVALEALQHGYNVLVEYPPAMSIREWEELQAAARARSLIIYVEWIVLWSAGHKITKQRLGALASPVAKSVVKLESKWELTSISNPFEEIGSPVFAGISRLARILDLFGENLEVESAQLEILKSEHDISKCAGFILTILLRNIDSGGLIEWIESRKVDTVRRKTSLVFETAAGEKIVEEPTGAGWQPFSSFAYDLSVFTHSVWRLDSAKAMMEANTRLSSKCMKFAEDIQRLLPKSV